ncbi:1-phosphofructokinase family hexose kinase [Amaricoccus tamworthensis]|uniref:1-phosphofructokinase family hexose kinase n=1 Tax=Amaricoccus tamworthensis TaxID=57002 RepID=UPI003C79E6EB
MTSILTITVNPALDLSTEAPAVVPDRKLRCGPPLVHPGGGGVNVSRAISNLGGTSRMLVAYGGPTGEMLVRELRGEGLEPVSLGIDYDTRQSLTVRDAATGLQYRYMMPGPAWTAEDCETARRTIMDNVREGDLVIPSGSTPPGLPEEFFLSLNTEVKTAGARMILDTSGATLERVAGAGAELFTLRMDLEEARELSDRPLLRIEEVAELARELRAAKAAEIVMIAAGAEGTVITCAEWTGLTRPPFVVPLSKVGAGDSFVGGYALSLTQNADPVEACIQGTASAASAVTTPGTALCLRDDVERFVTQVTRTPL